ncbi:VCBS domain-containing protein [uncultured Microbulbifer sp.]|uniref:VCBS domain-containing protein n=1 Tax=uncultured Microbulbifer sp. TaxID=348147 RepID=UPI00262DD620|nr:VCBS domain-containing protein [uncultured Microbulbifer sp.]
MNESIKLFSAISLTAFLTACGGGSGGDGDGNPETEVDSSGGGSSQGISISGGEGRVVEDSTASASGKLVDAANPSQTFENTSFQGRYGSLTVSKDGNWSYTLDSDLANPLDLDEQTSDVFTLGVGSGSDTTKISIQITGADDPYSFTPSVPLSTLVLNNKERASGQLKIEDVDGNTPLFRADTINGQYGKFTIQNDGTWAYSLDSNAGVLKAGETSKDTIKFLLTDGSEQSVTFSIATTDPTESSIVFIFMNFSDAIATREAGVSDIADMVFNDVDSLDNAYLENSQGQLKFLRHRIDSKDLPHYCYGQQGVEESSIDCITYSIPDPQNGGILSVASAQARQGQGGEYTDGGFSWRDDAHQWARDTMVDDNGQPLNLSDWRHQVYIYPSEAEDAGLIGTGIASVGGKWSVVAARTDQLVMGHELGHNIGLGHAGWDEDNDGRAESEYGTAGSLMGNRSKSRLFGSAHREVMGWYKLSPDYSTTVNQVTGSIQDIEIQAIELTAGELSGTLPQQLKVQSNGSKNGRSHYYVNYHVGHNILNPNSHYANSVTIHYLNDIDSNHVAVLESPGDFFEDNSAGITITYKSNSDADQSAVITVQYDN